MANETNDQDTGQKKMLPMILAIIIGLAVGGLGGAFVAGPLLAERVSAGGDASAAAPDEHAGAGDAGEHGGESGGPAVHTIDNMVLNPANSGGTRFLMATLAFSVADSSMISEMESRDAEVRDAVLRVLGRKTVLQLADVEGRLLLKQELSAAVDSLIGEHAVEDVYFPQFVIQ
ncbi:MAG TPA: flagellar basal body-associated FliL family protein [Longimicrobiaceae bacterium]|nr:flagellar basal body-associated FliL family protein [Longimicrobiaceae bacterium]